MSISEIAQFTGVRPANVRKMMDGYGVPPRPAWSPDGPKEKLALGPVWLFGDVRAMQERRLAERGPEELERDRQRSETHRARRV
jgi:hypothetical protein